MSAVRWLTACATAAVLFACTGGDGPSYPISTDPHEPTGAGAREPGGSSGPEPTGSSGPEPTSGGGESPTGGGGGACPPCDQAYVCVLEDDGGSLELEFTLATVNGQCMIETGTQTGVFSCDGTISVDGVTATWTSLGNGAFVVTDGVDTETCQPADDAGS